MIVIKSFKDITKEQTIYLISILILCSLVIHIPDFFYPVRFSDDKNTIKPFLESCKPNQIPDKRDPLRYYELCISDKVLTNTRIIPIISSLGAAILTFVFSRQITKSNTFSIIALGIFISTNSFNFYGFSATYSDSWVALLLGSLILINTRFYYLSFIPFMLSMFFRGLPLIDLPIFLSLIHFSNIKRKKELAIIYSVVTAVILFLVLNNQTLIENNVKIENNISFQNIITFFQTFRYEIIFSSFIPIMLFYLYKINSKQSLLIFISISWLLLQIWLLDNMTNLSQEPYRLFPLFSFMAIGIGLILKEKILNHYMNK